MLTDDDCSDSPSRRQWPFDSWVADIALCSPCTITCRSNVYRWPQYCTRWHASLVPLALPTHAAASGNISDGTDLSVSMASPASAPSAARWDSSKQNLRNMQLQLARPLDSYILASTIYKVGQKFTPKATLNYSRQKYLIIFDNSLSTLYDDMNLWNAGWPKINRTMTAFVM